VSEVVPPTIDGLTYVKKLGSGGFADVFLYQQESPKRQVAVKVLRDSGLSAKTVRNFAAEANAMGQLEHQYIVPVFGTGTTKDHRPYIVMMYYSRTNLAERARSKTLSVPETLRLGIQLGSAVETAHRAGLLHRDIKPANVLVNAYGRPGLTDFGIAGQMTDEDDPETGVSVPWSPPETLYGTAPASVRSDVYSLAATLWHLLVGRSPFEIEGGDNSAFAIMKRVRDLPPPSTGREDVPDSLDRLLRTAMSKEPSLRPSSTKEFIGALQAIEQQLRLTPTEIELAEQSVGHTVQRPISADATRVGRVQVVSPDRVFPPVVSKTLPSFSATDDSLETRPRVVAVSPVVGFRDEVDGETILRQADRDPATEVDEPARRKGRGAVIALAVLVLLVIVGMGWYLTAGQARTKPAAVTSYSEAPPGLGDGVPAGEPTVTCTRASGQVTCTWKYSGSKPDDVVIWRPLGSNQSNPSTSTGTATVPAPSADQVCIQVQVSRLDGSYTQPNWSKGCG